MSQQWKLCSNEQEQNFQIIDEQGLPVCVMCTIKAAPQTSWRNKKLTAKTLWYATASLREQYTARLITTAPELLFLARRLEVALPGDLPLLIAEARDLVAQATGDFNGSPSTT